MMVIKRRRFKQTTSVDERLAPNSAITRASQDAAPVLFETVSFVGSGQNEAASELCELLRSPGCRLSEQGGYPPPANSIFDLGCNDPRLAPSPNNLNAARISGVARRVAYCP
jgi:hypothetical protein